VVREVCEGSPALSQILRVDLTQLLSESPQRVDLYPTGPPAHAALARRKGKSATSVTAIKPIANRVPGVTYLVRNLENPNDTGGEGQYLAIGPGENRRVNMWIPWCNNRTDFGNGKRITLEALGTIQQEVSDTTQQEYPRSLTVYHLAARRLVYFSLDDRFETGQFGRRQLNC
jgi:hypothetical protein